jgi:hypothetical protein
VSEDQISRVNKIWLLNFLAGGSSYIPISMIRKCILLVLQDVEQILENAETCRPRSDLGRHNHCFTDLNFDGFRGLYNRVRGIKGGHLMLHIGAGVKTLSYTDMGVGHLMLHIGAG